MKLPKINLLHARKLIVSVLVISFIFSAGFVLGKSGYNIDLNGSSVEISRDKPAEYDNVEFSLFWKVWDALGNSYFDKSKLIPSQMVYGAIGGMVASIGDPYTVFLKPSDNKVVREDLNGNFDGVGIQIGFKGTQLVVIAPLPDSPDQMSGIIAGDLILAITDELAGIERSTNSITLPEAVKIIRGKGGTKVVLTILREGEDEPREIEITRGKIEVPSVVLEIIGEDIAHLKVLKFVGETDQEWNEAVTTLLKNRQITKLILDLRNNPGGYLQAAVDLASDFVDNGSVIVSEEKANGDTRDFITDSLPRLKNIEVVVLVNKGSASASEIFAGALRDLNTTAIIGDTTFGKGTIQEPIQVDNGAGLHITTARWLTPNGTWVNEVGLEPDVIISNDPETDEDEQLLYAEEILNNIKSI